MTSFAWLLLALAGADEFERCGEGFREDPACDDGGWRIWEVERERWGRCDRMREGEILS